MDQSNEKILYIIQYHFDKGDNAPKACERIFLFVKVLFQNQQRANGSLAFVLEISMSKMNPVLVGQ